MNMSFSIKYKLVILLVLFPIITLSLYFFLASKTFERDKIAYVYGSSLSNSKSTANQIDTHFMLVNKIQKLVLAGYDAQTKTFDKLSHSLFKDEHELKQITVYSKNKAYFTAQKILKKENFTVDIESKAYLKLLNKRKSYYKMIDPKKGLFSIYNKSKSSLNKKLYYTETIFSSKKIAQLFNNSGLFKNFFTDSIGSVLIQGENVWNKKILSFSSYPFFTKIQKTQSEQGTLESLSESLDTKLISYVKLFDGQYYVLTFFDKSKALEAVSVLKKKSLIFLFFTLALATILSVFSSSKITASLRNLFFATQEISKGNFNIDLDIKSNDEVGMLARSFNFMSKEILKLLTELKVYNEQLEELVDERTKELNQALRLQKAMVDSLDQGFFIFNDKAQILPVTSKASLEHFGQEPAGKNLTEVLKMSEAQGSEFVDFCDTMFAELLPFQDCVGLAPDIHKQENRTITLNYHPMRSETNEIEGVVLVSTDKTEELKAQHQAELDRAVSQMIMSISRDKFQFSKLLTNTKELLTKVEVMISGDESDFDIDDLFRYVHTLKGNLSLYHMKDLVNILHEIESRIISFQKGEIDIEHPVTENDVQMINLQFLKFFNTYGKVLGFKDFNSLDAKRSISEVALKDFYQILKENNSPEVLSAYENKFYFKKVEEIFTYMNHVIEQTSNITGKKVMPIQIDGGHHCIDYERYQNFFSSLVHAFRNAVDHGIETPIKRKENEKSETGKINVSYECKKNLHTFKIIDDGSGIDPTSIKEKLIKLDIRFDENLSDEELIQFIFHAGFSTNTKTTLISGRGVGMDTIKAEVLKLNGKITVHSQLKIGTEIHIQFPV